jgi:uncharacterized protein with ParB-like and HNH nuclease domain
MHSNFVDLFDLVFYNATAGAWYDYNNRTKLHNVYNYPSVATPLFTECYNHLDEDKPKRLFKLFLVSVFSIFSNIEFRTVVTLTTAAVCPHP